eukprot:CAMPEP_0172723136 /NCGR_PEP_ID=MMETSP1074-20121228/83072_1 /TAXON_ID=2916 /ORGANISM="Ceratium fusus, Strain PA161109" /LENGTH=162 /DNA_ID=CAMNT_0013549329 /DNA_START=40 /DNA_END=524 /DNA_ORIENTATION=+
MAASWSWTAISRVSLLASGSLAGAFTATAWRSRERQQFIEAGEYCELNGQFYQIMGHAWDHFRRDFCVVYRPLFNCQAKQDLYEAHVLATSHFEHFDQFRRVGYHELDLAAKGLALPGPFWKDSSWGYPAWTSPVAGAGQANTVQESFLAQALTVRTPTACG